MNFEYVIINDKKLYIDAVFICDVADLNKNKFEAIRKKYKNFSIDKKALSHAYRIVTQLEELCETGFIKFPLSKAQQIKDIKYGDMSFDDYQLLLQEIGSKIDDLKLKIVDSQLPEYPDRDLMDSYILTFMTKY